MIGEKDAAREPDSTSSWLSASEDNEPSLVSGRYQLLARLGTGASGVVYKACDCRRDGALVALKMLAPLDFKDPTARIRFEKEVTLTRDVHHPNLVEVYDFGTTETGQQFLSMEYVEGGTLGQWIYDDSSPLRFDEMLRILRDVAAGVGCAHAQGIVHRDLKPDNILLSGDGRAKVADFGLARQMAAGHTITHSADTVGTPYYMAPEQFQHHRVDGRADIYSLGIIAYEMVTKTRPFMSEVYQQIALAHMNSPMPSFYEKGGAVPKWFETFVLICTEKKVHDRFQSMDEVVCFLDKRMRKMGLLEGAAEKEPFYLCVLAKLLGEA